jgi:hypothetical protein
LALETIIILKKKLAKKESNISSDYIKIVNYARVIFVYIIQLLYDNSVKLNDNLIGKFLNLDNELDRQEKKDVSSKLLNYDFVRGQVDTNRKLGNY